MIKELNLEELWQVINTLSNKQSELCEQNIFVHLLGHRSNYGDMSFEGFLNYYSFRVDGEEIVVFNQDGIPYESYNNDDYSYIPTCLLSFSAEKLENWIKIETDLQLQKQEREKLAEKESIRAQIARLEKQLEN